MTENEPTTSPSKMIATFFFHNKISVTALVLVMVLSTALIPGVGALAPILITLIALFSCKKSGSIKMIGLNRPESWSKTIIYGAIIGFTVQMIFKIALDPLFELITGTQLDLSNLDNMKGDFPKYLIWLTIGWVVGGFLEEISFRGYLITRIKSLLGENNFSTSVAVLASAIPFGLAHLWQGWAGVLSTGLFGFIFAILFIRNRYNVWLLIMIHGFVNTTDLTLIYFDLSETLRLF